MRIVQGLVQGCAQPKTRRVPASIKTLTGLGIGDYDSDIFRTSIQILGFAGPKTPLFGYLDPQDNGTISAAYCRILRAHVS